MRRIAPLSRELGRFGRGLVVCLGERFAYSIRVLLDDAQVRPGGAVWAACAVFPVTDVVERNLELPGEFALGEAQLLANLLRIGDAPEPGKLLGSERRVVRVVESVLMSFFAGHGGKVRPISLSWWFNLTAIMFVSAV